MSIHHDDESPHYQLPSDPPLSGPSAQADVVAQPSAAVSTARCSGDQMASASMPTPEHAFTLYCHGHRTSAIAAHLGVSPRTIRRWLRQAIKELVLSSRDERIAELVRAIESQRSIITAAWDSYTRESRRAEQLPSGQPDPLAHYFNAGHRYLAVISSAQREIARLENLYDQTLLTEASHISITITRRPEGPENVPPHERPLRFPHLYPQGAPGFDSGPESHGPLDDDRDDDDDLDKPGQDKENPA